MISFFPSPYPDELWYSVICRYHVHSGNYCAKHTLRQLYGDNFCAPSLMLCGPIKALVRKGCCNAAHIFPILRTIFSHTA